MTPNQQAALEALAGRALDAGDVATLDPLLAVRDDLAVSAHLSVGRVRLEEFRVSELVVRRELGVVPASRLLKVLRDSAAAADAGVVEPWLGVALAGMGVPTSDHDAYQETVGAAWRWLTQAEGLDVGAAAARDMLDLIAAGVPAVAAACATIKGLAVVADPLSSAAVSTALNEVAA